MNKRIRIAPRPQTWEVAPVSERRLPIDERAVASPWLLAAILLLAFLLRAAGIVWGQSLNPDGGQGDALEAVEVATDCLRGEGRWHLGQPRFRPGSKLPGPAWTLVCAGALRVGGSPEAIAWILVAANVGAIGLTWSLARRTVGDRAAIWATLLLAVSPLAVQNSVVIYNPALAPLLGGALALALWEVTGTERSRAIAAVPVLCALLLQIHMSVVFLLPAVVALVWLGARRLHGGWAAVGFLGGILVTGPYLLGDAREGWANTRAMFGAATAERSFEPLAALISPARFLLSHWAPRSLYTDAELLELQRQTLGGPLGYGLLVGTSAVVALAAVVGAAWLVGRALRAGGGPRAIYARAPGPFFLALLIVLSLVTGVLLEVDFRPRYCLVILPALFALAGAGLEHLRSRGGLLGGLPALAGLVILGNVWFVPAQYRFQGRQIDAGPRFLGSFRNLERVDRALRAAAGEGARIELLDDGFQPPAGWNWRWYVDVPLLRRYVRWREWQRPPTPETAPVRRLALFGDGRGQPLGNGLSWEWTR
ncbi:MAG: glycosyltransferase family 39 protein [Verrucomicrobia bacterium]|nr:glycosyltransferase family 39 protein [Verrucomicrobiota bacterium]